MLGWFGFGWLNQRGRRALLEVLLLDVGCVVFESQVSVLRFLRQIAYSPKGDVLPLQSLGYDP
jgi:hypothetical protein